jgi:hypothetical protein
LPLHFIRLNENCFSFYRIAAKQSGPGVVFRLSHEDSGYASRGSFSAQVANGHQPQGNDRSLNFAGHVATAESRMQGESAKCAPFEFIPDPDDFHSN